MLVLIHSLVVGSTSAVSSSDGSNVRILRQPQSAGVAWVSAAAPSRAARCECSTAATSRKAWPRSLCATCFGAWTAWTICTPKNEPKILTSNSPVFDFYINNSVLPLQIPKFFIIKKILNRNVGLNCPALPTMMDHIPNKQYDHQASMYLFMDRRS